MNQELILSLLLFEPIGEELICRFFRVHLHACLDDTRKLFVIKSVDGLVFFENIVFNLELLPIDVEEAGCFDAFEAVSGHRIIRVFCEIKDYIWDVFLGLRCSNTQFEVLVPSCSRVDALHLLRVHFIWTASGNDVVEL